MLSIVDLIEAGTITSELAAYSLAAIAGGASFLVGALPGGAGKTTVMGALLNFVPTDAALRSADSLEKIRRGATTPRPRYCYICHEIGRGPHYAYLWGEEIRAYFGLTEARHMIATNLHADDYAQARQQICVDNGVSPEALQRMSLMFFLEVSQEDHGVRRRVVTAWESDGRSPHRRIFPSKDAERSSEAVSGSLAGSEATARARFVLDSLVAEDVRDIEHVRERIVESFPSAD